MNNSNVGIHSFLPHIHTFRSPHVQPSSDPLSQPSLALHAHVQTSPPLQVSLEKKTIQYKKNKNNITLSIKSLEDLQNRQHMQQV